MSSNEAEVAHAMELWDDSQDSYESSEAQQKTVRELRDLTHLIADRQSFLRRGRDFRFEEQDLCVQGNDTCSLYIRIA